MSKEYLKGFSDYNFPTNGLRQITAANHRSFNNALIDSCYLAVGSIIIWPGKISTIPENWRLCDGSQFSISNEDYTELFNALGGYASPYGVDVANDKYYLPNIQPAQSVIQEGISKFQVQHQGSDYQLGEILTAPAPVNGTSATFKVIGVGQGFDLQIISRGSNYVVTGIQPLALTGGTGTGASIFIFSANKLGATGGEETHTLTANEIPAHTHNVNGNLTGATGTAQRTLSATGSSDVNTDPNTTSGLAHNNMPPFIAMNYIIKVY